MYVVIVVVFVYCFVDDGMFGWVGIGIVFLMMVFFRCVGLVIDYG